ncbi:neuronal acetylcholine receptor subunit beta-4-like [Haliotis rubra]|uniref:neuronal acetylcholine receptor subunit beta-4-like n=1 Tax=Haliotis rubra TaxID=36100 RepID=UPI001EE51C0A|nr:neuronal acetylcholine receptor subunit beta-4-like [Haliotis rubra]
MYVKILYVLLATLLCVNTIDGAKSALGRLKTHVQEDRNAGISVDLHNEKQVNISMLPMSISNLNAAEQTFTFSAGFSTTWLDRNLAWNKTDYENITKVTISEKHVWTPVFAIPNALEDVTMSSKQLPKINMYGITTLQFLEGFKTTCQIDITLYPFDQQRCSILFTPANNFDLVISTTGSIIQGLPSFFIENSEWELVDILAKDVHVNKPGISSVASFEFLLKRKSMFYIVSIIFPMTLLSLLNACVFLLPADSGEKMSYLISIFVSYAVFMNFVNDSIPKSGDVCRLSMYLTLVLCQSCLAIITTMATLNVRSRGLLLQTKSGVHPANAKVTTNGTERQHLKCASKTDLVLFGVFLLLALMSLLVFCV